MCAASGACSHTAPARPQLLVVIDTDAHVVGELTARQDVSADATIDTLRIDVLDASGMEYAANTFVVSSSSAWPVSFGIQPPATGSGAVLVRVRAFRALFATGGTVLGGQATLDPDPDVTIDRLVALAFPDSGEQVASVTLAEDCMGIPVGFGSPQTTCVDASTTSADPHTGVTSGGDSPSVVGTWAPALDVPCGAQPDADQVCIAGGFTIMGDLNDVGATAFMPSEEPVPLRPAIVGPFLLDKYEFTVGRMRALVQSGSIIAPPTTYDPTDESTAWCTWLGPNDASNDQKPVNCIGVASAAQACALAGGRLPTEVEWEFAARGRGQRLTFPWGNTVPQCCTSSLSRPGPDFSVECLQGGSGVENVGSHPVQASCAGTGDVSRDGVFDMGGSVEEAVSTSFVAYSDPCWQSPGIVRGAPCTSGTVLGSRGSNWSVGLATAFSAARNYDTNDFSSGFRCAADGAP